MRHLYGVFDNKANVLTAYVQILHNDAVAHRWYNDLMNNERMGLNAHPTDYDLVSICQIDENDLVSFQVNTPEPHREHLARRTVITGHAWHTARLADDQANTEHVARIDRNR